MSKILFGIIVMLIGFVLSCKLEHIDYPPEPYIEYISAEATIGQNALNQSLVKVKLIFYLIDGDGDVGLTELDTIYPYDANFYPTLYGFVNDSLKVDTTLIADEYRIPYVGDLGQDKTLKAEIIIDFEYPFNDMNPYPYDSIVYSFYMVDRALNKSNVAWTDTIVIP